MLKHQDYLENMFFFIIFEKKYFTPFYTFSNYQKTFSIWLVNEIHEIMEKLLNHSWTCFITFLSFINFQSWFSFQFISSLLFCIFFLLQDFSYVKS